MTQQLAQLGPYIDQNTNRPVTAIALDYTQKKLLAGVSVHTFLISFWEETEHNGFNETLSLEEIHARTYASNAIRALERAVPVAEKSFFIQEYGVSFIVAEHGNVELYKGLIQPCGIVVESVFETEDLSSVGAEKSRDR